jgi:carboxylesterase type B
MRHSFYNILASIALVDAQIAWTVGQTVKTTSGTLVGKASSWKNSVSEYLGVPYALPPTGDLRWAAPQPLKDRSGATVNATTFVRLSLQNAWMSSLLM